MYDHTHEYIKERLHRIRQYADDGLLVRAAYAAGELDSHLLRVPDVDHRQIWDFLLDLKWYLADEELRLRRALADRERGPDGALRI